MRLNKRLIQRQLDKAAEQLEREGHEDLANKVDRYNSLLMNVKSSKGVDTIQRGLQRIYLEAKRREEPRKARRPLRKRPQARKGPTLEERLRAARRAALKAHMRDRRRSTSREETPRRPRLTQAKKDELLRKARRNRRRASREDRREDRRPARRTPRRRYR